VKSPLQGSYNRIPYKWWNETIKHPRHLELLCLFAVYCDTEEMQQ